MLRRINLLTLMRFHSLGGILSLLLAPLVVLNVCIRSGAARLIEDTDERQWHLHGRQQEGTPEQRRRVLQTAENSIFSGEQQNNSSVVVPDQASGGTITTTPDVSQQQQQQSQLQNGTNGTTPLGGAANSSALPSGSISYRGPPTPGSGGRSAKVLFGTRNGYDVGGTEPLCWDVVYSTQNSTITNSTATNHIELRNQELYELADAASLRPECYSGTVFTMTAQNLLPANTMYLDEPYDFVLNLTMNLTEVLQTSTLSVKDLGGAMDVYFRLHLCDAIKQSFCNPIIDTRDMDANLTRQLSDIGVGDNDSDFPEDDNKWAYTQGTILRTLTDNATTTSTTDGNPSTCNTLLTRWCKWTFQENSDMPDIFTASILIGIQAPLSSGITEKLPRAYFILGHAELDFDLGNDQILRIDIAQTPTFRVVYIEPEPEILHVSLACKVVLGVAIAISGSLALFCLAKVVYHGKHPVMQLAQGKFLATMTAACLVQIVFSFTFLPVHDVYCQMQGLLELVPVTVVAAILMGRAWRIYSALAGASSLGQKSPIIQHGSQFRVQQAFIGTLDFLAVVWTYFRWLKVLCFWRAPKKVNLRQHRRPRTSQLRRVVSAEDTACLITILSLPQFVIQLVGVIIAEHKGKGGLVTEYTELGNIGRVVCRTDGLNRWLALGGTLYASFVYLLAVLMAWFSRDLPSAFNEKDQIFNAATISCMLTAMSIGLGEVINEPSTPPDAAVILNASVSIGIATSVLFLIVWPKVMRVLQGEKVVVSQMLGSRYVVTSTVSESESASIKKQQQPQPENGLGGEPLVLKEDDPIPTHIETKIFDVQSLLRSVLTLSGDGRSLSKEVWEQMQEQVSKLKENLDLVNLERLSVEKEKPG